MNVKILHQALPYEDGLRMQEQIVQDIVEGKSEDLTLLLEHEPVYTMGRQRDQSSLRDVTKLPASVFEINRGGQATYHGPGQLVGYLLWDLKKRGQDLHAHLRMIEDTLIATCHDFGVMAQRREALTGVWVSDRKLASIGVGVRKWISMHGFAINITDECLPYFSWITPCGIGGVQMTSLSREAGREISVQEFAEAIAKKFTLLLLRSN